MGTNQTEKSHINWSSVSSIIALLLIIITIVVFLRNFTFGFLPLFIVLGLFMWIVGIKLREFRMKRNKAMLASSLIVFSFGALCIIAMNNYVNPSRAVFTNNDHHAIAMEGIHINDTRAFNLAEDSPNAFFDNDIILGNISLGSTYNTVSPSGDTIKVIPIKKTGFSIPIYERQRDSLYWMGIRSKLFLRTENYFRDIDDNSEEVFSSGDEIILSQGGTSISFTVNECPDSLGSHYTIKFIQGSQEIVETSPFTTYIRKSYPLSSMFQDIEIPNFNLDGIILYRTVFFDTQIDKVRKTYDHLDAKYRIALNGDAVPETKIQIKTTGYSFFPAKNTSRFELIADGTTVYSIGNSEEYIPQFRFYPERDGVSLRYRMPQYRYLSADYAREGRSREELSFMHSTTILEPDGSVNKLIPENILLFDRFEHPNNIHQMKPVFYSFVSGATNDKLEVSLYSADGNIQSEGLVAGDKFPELLSVGGRIKWIVSLDNFKDPNLVRPGEISRPMSSKTMAEIIIIVTLLSVIMLLIQSGKRYTYVEPMAYLILLGFLTVRLFLLWRISVFPPVMSTSVLEFNNIFRSNSALNRIICLLAFFYSTILCVKLFGVRNRSRLLSRLCISKPIEDERLLKRVFIIMCCLPAFYILGAVSMSLLHITERMVCVLLPLIFFFVFDYISNRLYGGVYKEEYNSDIDLRYIWVLIANSFGATIYCFIMDGGFGVIFLIFSILNIVIRLIDAFLYKSHDEGKIYINRWIYILSILAIIFIAFSKKILLLLLDIKLFAIVLFIILSLVFFVIILSFNIIYIEDRKLQFDKKAIKFLVIGISAIAAISSLSLFAPKVFEGKHIEYRLRVQQEDPGRVLGKMNSATAERKFMEASINDWIMGEYESRGKTVSSIVGEHGHGYFKIQPQSKVGALWGAQTTDISLSRYIIAEHGRMLAIMFVIILGLMLIFCVSFVSNRVWSKSIITQIPLLLSVQGLLVWMAVTQRFIFLGQDFPMISITSTLTSVEFIGFLMLLVIVAIIETTLTNNSDEVEEIKSIIKTNKSLSIHVLIFSGVVLALLILMGNQRRNQFYTPIGKGKIVSRYDVKSSLESLNTVLNSFNNDFVSFQKDYLDSLNMSKPKRNRSQDITTVFNTPYQALKTYCNYFGYNPETDEIKTEWAPIVRHFDVAGESYSKFCKMAFDRYLLRSSKINDINGLLFIVKKKSRTPDGTLNVVYELKANSQYYIRELPRSIQDSWRGNVLSHPTETDFYDITTIAQEPGYTVYTIPQEWTGTSKMTRLVKSASKKMVVVGKTKPVVLHKGESILLSEYDNVLVNGDNIDLSKYGTVSYLAKNIMINGVSSFIYPLQDKLYWMRPFSDAIRMDKATTDAKEKASTDDIYITLSTRLTSAIYDAIGNVRPDYMTAVVVADGEGNLISMVDHKDIKHRINPNDSKRIVKKENELKLEGEYYWGQEAENFFGNKAITNLRFGPGSSQKPLLWSAVTTEYNEPSFWKNLRLSSINPYLMEKSDNSHFSTRYIAGTLLSKGSRNESTGKYSYFQSITSDEGGGLSDVDLSSYLYKSSNYYNAVMSLIGSYSYDDLKNGLTTKDVESSLFVQLKKEITTTNQASDSLLYRQSFPIIQDGDGRPKAFKTIPSIEIMSNAENSVLVKGLNDNFGLTDKNDDAARPVIYQYETDRVKEGFAHPQESYFYNKWRMDRSDMIRADNAIRYTAIGASSVWQVSPLVMAQMYGKLISLNKNYTLSLEPTSQKIKSYSRFDIDGVPSSYDNLSRYSEIRHIFEKGLSQVFSETAGTGRSVFSSLNAEGYIKNLEKAQLTALSFDGTAEKNLYFYGKTGTINGDDESGRTHTDHLLAVIITDTDLESIQTFDDYEKMKFYVLYLADFDNVGWVASDAAVINVVLSSKEFKSYMGIK